MNKNILYILLIILLSIYSLSPEEISDYELFDIPDEHLEPVSRSEGQIKEEPLSIYGYIVNFSNIELKFSESELTSSSFGNILYLRLKGDWNPGPNLSFHSELSYCANTGNQNMYAILESYGILPQYYQENHTLSDFIHTLNIDHFWGTINLWLLDFQFGKMPIAWGAGYVFNPTQKVSSTPVMDTVTEETPGTLGIVTGISITDSLYIQGYIAFEDKTHKTNSLITDSDWNNLPYGIKIQGIAGPFDLSLSWIKEVSVSGLVTNTAPLEILYSYNKFHYAGLDFAGAIWNFGIYGEAAIHIPQDAEFNFNPEGWDIKENLEVCMGFDYSIPVLDIDIRAEYYHQGKGENDKINYAIDKLFTGEQIVLGQDYLFLYLEKVFLDYFKISSAGLININDSSFAILPLLTYDMYSNFQVELGSIIMFGSEGSEYGGEFNIPHKIDYTRPSIYLRGKLSF